MFEQNAVRALVLALIAGLSTLVGAALVLIGKKKSEKMISVSLGFAAGVMLSVSFVDLFPHAVDSFSQVVSDRMSVLLTVLFLAVGVGLAMLLDHFVPHEAYDPNTGETPHKNLFRVGFVSMLAIGLHNFPEGIATFMAGFEDLTLGISIAIAISLHNIPEGIAVAMPIYFSTGSRKKALYYTTISALAEPLGALLAFLVLRPFFGPGVLAAVFAAVAGIMVYISVEELIPSSRQYGHDRAALLATLTGICLMPLSEMI